MKTVLVRARPGRLAYTAPSGGVLIPTDKWIPAERTRWIDKLAEKHGDIEVKPFTSPGSAPARRADPPAEPASEEARRAKSRSTPAT